MRTKVILAAVLASFALVGACVGDDPATAGSTSDDGGTGGGDGTVAGDGGSGSDSSPGSDGSTPTGDGGIDAGFPTSLSGLALWLDADFISGTAGASVTNWPDHSGNNNNATTAAATTPALLYHVSKFNGHSAVTFQNNNLFLSIADSPTMRVDNTGFLLEIVEANGALAVNGSQQEQLYSKLGGTDGDGLHVFMSIGGAGAGAGLGFGPDNEATVDMDTLSTSVANRIRVRFDPFAGNDGGVLSVQGDQGAASTDSNDFDTLPDISGGTAPATIGELLNNGDTVSIAAIILVKGKVSDDDVNNLETYLNTRYGL